MDCRQPHCPPEGLATPVVWCDRAPRAQGLLPKPPPHPPRGMQIYSVESHRLALALDRRGLLVQIVRSAVLHAMGLSNKDNVRLANLF